MKRRSLFPVCFILVLILMSASLAIWTAAAETEVHYTPEYEKIDLIPVLQKESLTDEDYALLFQQTGLTGTGVEELYDKGRQNQLLYLQWRFFTPIEYECQRSNIFCRSERIVRTEKSGAQSEEICDFIPAVQDGDILVTFSGHLFGWRSGHAALVVNAEGGETLEAISLGKNSQICSLGNWNKYPCFAQLRLKNASKEERAEIAAYAEETLVNVPYKLSSLCKDETVTGTHCSHLVWMAYRHFGYDLNSDGGYIVTPYDIYDSGFLELIQVYGMDVE